MLLALRLRPTILLTVFGVTVAIAVACADGTDPNGHIPVAHGASGYAPVTSVELKLNAPSLIAGRTTQATAVAKDLNGLIVTDRTVTWTSLNPSVATVSAGGLVTAVAPGSATIRATVESVSGDAALSATPVPIANIAVSLPVPSVTAGQTTQASAVVTDTNGTVLTGQTLTWSSSNPAVATVSAAGVVTAVASGSAAIRATEEGHFGEASLSVPAPVAAVSVSLSSASLMVGQTTQATAVASDSAGAILTGRSVSWTSLSPSVATVSPGGTVTAVAAGTVTIRATVESKTGDAPLTVGLVPVATVSVTLASPTLTVGRTTQATAVASDSGGTILTGRSVSWTSLSPGVATVSPGGTVTAVAPGTATIRATVESKTGDAPLTASSVPVATVSVTLASPSVTVGQTTQATAIAIDASGSVLTGRVVGWASLNTNIATVSPSGTVTAVASGSATIRATVETKTGDATLTATSPIVSTVTVSTASQNLIVGGTTQATAIAIDAGGTALTGRPVTWTSSATSVATVSSTGLVTAVSAGSAAIQATVDSKTGSAPVNVTASSSAPVATVTVNLGSSIVATGGGTQATATASDANGTVLTGRTVVWTSSAPTVATVSSTGVVTAIAAGTANIQATVDTKTGSATVAVTTSAPVPVATVAVTLGSSSLTTGGGTQATATAIDANGNVLTGRIVVWTSSAPTVATVSSTGVVTAIAAGTASIQATVDTKTGSASVAVTTSAPVPVATVAVTLGSSSLTTGGGTQATAVVKDANGNVLTGRTVVWASSAPTVASVSSTGVVTAIAAGTANIQAIVETKVAAAPLSVTAATNYVPPADHPHEPPAMTMLLTHDASTVQPVGWNFSSGQVSIVTDGEKGNALQLGMTPMTVPGSATAEVASDIVGKAFAPTKLYMSWWQKLSPNFKGNNAAGGEKNAFLYFGQRYNSDAALLGLINDATNVDSRIRGSMSLYNTSDHDGNHVTGNMLYYVPGLGEPGDPGDLFPRGTWHFFEVLWTSNTRGYADGTYQEWIDGVSPAPLTRGPIYVDGLQGSGIAFAYDGMPRWTGININNTWGGGGTAIPADNYYRFKDIYISGGYARAGERPSHWVISVDSGGTSTPAAGTSVAVKAQLFDENNNPVDVFNPNPSTTTVTGPTTWRYRAGTPPGYPEAEHGVQLYWIDVNPGAASGQDIAISVSDFAKASNGTVNADQRLSNTLHLTVK